MFYMFVIMLVCKMMERARNAITFIG